MDLPNLPPGTPVWLTIFLVLSMLFASLSERMAKLKGPLGAAARWWNARQVREVQNKRSLDAQIDQAVTEGVARRMEGVDATIAELRAQVEQLRNDLNSERESWRQERIDLNRAHAEEVSRLRAEDRLKYQYILYVAGRLREYRLWAAEHGHALPPPTIPGYFSWAADHQSAERARYPPDDEED